MRLTDKTRLFARHENIASLSGPFALNDIQQRENTVVGLSSDDLRHAQLFSEFRMRDAVAGREAQAAIGLRNRWALNAGLAADAGFERVVVVRGGTGTSTAITGGLEYSGSPLWKGTLRGEVRRQDGSDQWLGTAAAERKLSRTWAALGHTEWFRDLGAERTDGRSQLGMAYRGTETNRLSALARYDNRVERQGGPAPYTRISHVLSSHANWQPRLKLTLSGQAASKWTTEDQDRLLTRTTVQLVSGRALVDLTQRLDAGVTGRAEFGGGRRFGLGGELGFVAMTNVRVAAGYNVFGFRDPDMIGVTRTDRGPYVDFGVKFDPFWSPSAPAPHAGGAR